jgi:hypothetical protein
VIRDPVRKPVSSRSPELLGMEHASCRERRSRNRQCLIRDCVKKNTRQVTFCKIRQDHDHQLARIFFAGCDFQSSNYFGSRRSAYAPTI